MAYNVNDMNRTIKTGEQIEEIEEIKEFLGHIQPRVGEAAFAQIWKTVERLENRLNKSDCISGVISICTVFIENDEYESNYCKNCGNHRSEH